MTKSNVVKLPNAKQVEFGGLNLQLRLDGKSILNIEKRLDESLMGLFLNGNGGMRLPATNKLLIVLQGANQTSNVGDSDIVRAFDKYIDEGRTTLELFTTIQELLEESGFFGKDKTEETNGVSLDSEVIESDLL
ncbi:MAG: DUF6096 family protein [Lactococcus sp.]|nr:DUF6096 family protein [Lactococcus sp.]MDN5404306.1 DUF6096 family protein [Lactococcus sp.]MDN5410670.1 DUF6096 family protein [Lactococcus sp.]MDN5412775.1 DUF6096 family protein [Lactococcus sp.]MDN5437191.1 DUF6096 family protein [Lactococcus sp.]MDN5462530.1 DUF6096 family protein [Lactococcus sp.]